MVPKPTTKMVTVAECFRAVLFRMVPKLNHNDNYIALCFRAVLFRMVPKRIKSIQQF